MPEEFKEKYNNWNLKKQDIQFKKKKSGESNIYFKEADIWWCSIGINIGTESYGKGENFRRPVLIMKKLSADLCIALPLTSKEKMGTWFIDVTFHGEKKWVMLYQIRTLNKKRFYLKMGQLDPTDMKRVKEKLECLLKFSNRHPTEVGIEGNNPKSTHTIQEAEEKSRVRTGK